VKKEKAKRKVERGKNWTALFYYCALVTNNKEELKKKRGGGSKEYTV